MASLEEIRATRLAKLNALKARGLNPYPTSVARDHELAEISDIFASYVEKGTSLSLVGRVMSLRPHGGLLFFTFNDGTGSFQGLLKRDEMDAPVFDLFSETVDVGDFIEVTGTLFLTKRNEKTLKVASWKMLAKALRQLPEKWHGLQDVEERFRRRYLDTLMSPEVKDRFILRSRIVSTLRKLLDKEGFLEVETPMLQSLAGGASAEPFKTHHNALDIDLYLRIAPELYLKKLMVGGFPKVYEIGRDFRNEGIDTTHNPEFTMAEWYESYSNASAQQKFVEKTLKLLVKAVAGSSKVIFDGNEIDFSKRFSVISYFDLLKRYALVPNPETVTFTELKLKAEQMGVRAEEGDTVEKLMDSVYKKVCRPKLIQPTFIVDYPVNYLPLAKRRENDPALVDAFQLIVGGLELVKAFSELNDPLDQRERFLEQDKNRAAGDKEAQQSDEEFLEALEYGMPPAGGVGIGIDRLAMLLGNTKNIREVILFPTLRPR